MSDQDFTQVSGLLDSSVDAQNLLKVFRSNGVDASVDGSNLFIGGAGLLSVEFDKGINKVHSESGARRAVIEQVEKIVQVLSQSGIDFFIEVCDDDWNEIVTYGDYGRN